MYRKQTFLIGVLVLTQLVLAGPIPIQTPGIPEDESIAYRPVATPVIDGDLSDWVEDPETEWIGAAFKYFGEQQYVLRGDWGGPDDSSILWSVMWDDTYFYFAAAVWDDVLTAAPSIPAAWQGDAIFLYIDGDADGTIDHFSSLLLFEEEPYVVSLNNASVDPDNRIPYPDGQVEIIWDERLGAAGRFVEAAIPLVYITEMSAVVGGEFRLNVGLEEGNQNPDGGKFLSWTGQAEPGDPGNQRPVYFSDPVFKTDMAAYPDPVNNTTNVPPDVVLTWRPGKYADTHDIYFGANWDDVNDANNTLGFWSEFKGNQDPCSYDPGILTIGQTYHWRVDEVNAGPDFSIYKGDVWSFMVADYLVVDDFEAYDDIEPDRVFDTWRDGWDVDENGAIVGYASPDLAAGEHYLETGLYHGGKQSMPLIYDTDMKYAEAWLPLTGEARNLTREGVETLSLWFKGFPEGLSSASEAPEGTFTINGAGTDIWADYDEFHFVYKELTGSVTIRAKVESLDNTDPFAKAGVMIRDTLKADSAYASVLITPENGARNQYRTSAGNDTEREFDPNLAAPYWVRVERTSGGLVRAYYSADGNTWTQFALRVISMTQPVYVGLAVTSHNPEIATQAVITNVTITGNGSDQPWSNQDVGIISNQGESLFVAVNDGVVYHEDPNATQIEPWSSWQIPLQVFADQGVDLTDADRITVGIGMKDDTTQSGSQGQILIDDIRLYLP